MAVGWVAVLKMVPWADVIEATPQLVQASRRLLGNTSRNSTANTLHDLQQRITLLEDDQQQTAQLIEQLAQQNAQMVDAIEILRVRSQWLMVAVGVLSAALVGLLVWQGLGS